MKSTLYLKFIFIYIVFGFLSLFTAATLTENLVSTPIFNRVSNSMYREATMVANDYLPGYFSGGLTESDAQMILSGIETQLDAAVWFVSKNRKIIFFPMILVTFLIHILLIFQAGTILEKLSQRNFVKLK